MQVNNMKVEYVFQREEPTMDTSVSMTGSGVIAKGKVPSAIFCFQQEMDVE